MYTLLCAVLFLLPQNPPASGQQQPGSQPGQGTAISSPLQDGQWTVICAEMDGQKLEEAKLRTVTVQGNTLTYAHDGKQCVVRLEFGPNNTIRATKLSQTSTGSGGTAGSDRSGGTAGSDRSGAGSDRTGAASGQETCQGVYVAAQDFFCVCIDADKSKHGQDTAGKTAGEPTNRPGSGAAGANDASAHKGKMVLILRKGSANGR